jgi:dTDP-glucose 4,6-dehydratase
MHSMLVTGGAGFIGSNFIHYVLRHDPTLQIVNLDALTYAGNLHNLDDLPDPNRYAFIQGNITDRALISSILKDHQMDTIVHFAAETHVDRSIEGAELFLETNINGTYCLLESARNYLSQSNQNLPFRFHHISTDEVFGSLAQRDPPFTENTPYAPNSPYAASKAASDHLVRAYHHTYDLPVTISNCSNNYGPYQFPEKLIPLTIINALKGKPLPIYGDGQQIRDWLYVEDHCSAIFRILQTGVPGETYNIGGNNQPTNLEIVNTICSILDELAPGSNPYQTLIKFVPDRPGHDRRYAMDIRKIRNSLGWSPGCDLQGGLKKTVQWYLHHSKWIETILERPDYQAWIERNYSSRKSSE